MNTNISIFHALAGGPPLGGGYAVRVVNQLLAQRRAGMRVEAAMGPQHALEAYGRWGDAPTDVLTAEGLDWRLFRSSDFPFSIRWRHRLIGAPYLTGFDWHLRETRKVHEAYARLLAERLDPPPDVIVAHSPALRTEFGFILAELLKRPVVYDIHGMVEESNAAIRGEAFRRTGRYRAVREAETRAALRADHCFMLCQALREEFAERGVPQWKMTVIPNAVNPADYTEIPQRDDALARRLGLEGARVIGCVTSMTAYESLETIIDAVAILRARGINAKALFAGDGAALGRFRRHAGRSAAAGHIVFAGRIPRDQVPQHLAQMDAFCVSRRSAMVCQRVTPLKPFEALAAGCPLVISDLPALRETVQNGRFGWKFEPENAESLAGVCERLFSNPGGAQRVAAAAREWVLRERNWDVLALTQDRVLRRVIGRRE